MRSSFRQFSDLSTAEKIELLTKEFEKIDINHDSKLSYKELCQALDDMNDGREFDRDIARQLFDEMDKNHDESVSIQEFINIYLRGEDVLKKKISQCQKVNADCMRQRRDVEYQLARAEKTEKLNAYMVKEGSVCSVTVVEALDLPIQPDTIIQVRIACEKDYYESKRFKYKGRTNVNQTINVPITTGHEILRVIVVVPNSEDKKGTEIGEANLPVEQLKDQAHHNGTVNLERANGESPQGSLNLNLQWIRSSVEYLKEVLNKWDLHIQQINNDLQDYQNDLKTLYEPFRLLKGLKDMRNSAKPIETKIVENPFTKWHRYGQYVTLIMLAFAFLACFNRSTFIDILIGVAFMFSSHKHFQEVQGFTAVLFGTGLSILYDMVWLTIYSAGWSNEVVPGDLYSWQDREFCIKMSYLLFLTKCMMLYVYAQVDKQFKARPNIQRQSIPFDLAGAKFSTAPNTNEIPNYYFQ